MRKIDGIEKDNKKDGYPRETQRQPLAGPAPEERLTAKASYQQKDQLQDSYITKIKSQPQQKGRENRGERMALPAKSQEQAET